MKTPRTRFSPAPAQAPVPAAQHGATLIEVLVAIVVLSIGLLGLAGLQMTALQSNHSAYMRSQASVLAADLSDRIRAVCGEDPLATAAAAYADNSAGDRALWDADLVRALGAGAQGNLVINGQAATVTIQWNDKRGDIKASGAASTPRTESFPYQTEPCAP